VRRDRVEPQFVEFIPDVLEDGVVYISVPYGAIIHACCCGCGSKVSTPLSPAQWNFTYDGEHISLSPSVGSGALQCNSHYIISRNEVRWARSLTKTETAASLQRDHAAAAQHYEPEPTASVARDSWWRRCNAWVRARIGR